MKMRMKLVAGFFLLCMLHMMIPAGWAAEPVGIREFVPYEDTTVFVEALPGDDVLGDLLPDSATAILEDGSRVEIPVTWSWTEELPGEWILCHGAWDENAYPLAPDAPRMAPFVEIVAGEPRSSEEVPAGEVQNDRFAASQGIRNILLRAYQQVTIPWTPVKTVEGYLNSKNQMTAVYQAGTTYHGIPYGMQVASGKYVPLGASFDTFLSAVRDGDSLFYRGRGSYPAFYNVTSTYYATDCAAFVGYSYGMNSYLTTYTIYSSYQFQTIRELNDIQVGDCLLEVNSHVMLVTGVRYNPDGSVAALEVSQSTPPKAKTSVYTYEEVQKLFQEGYIIKRYYYRDRVPAPLGYSGYDSGKIPFGRCDIQLEYQSVTYDGAEKKPGVKVMDGITLTEGADYTVTYLNNIHSGTGFAKITPMGTYAGDPVLVPFTVLSPLPFRDLSTAAWSFQDISEAYAQGLVHGVSATALAPNDPVTRAQGVQFLCNLEKADVSGCTPCTFADVDQKEWYAGAVNWATENTLVQGYSEQVFGVKDPLTREQFAKIVVSYLENLRGYRLEASELPYTDVEAISDWAVEPLKKAQGIDLFKGYPDGSFSPQNTITREQAVVLMVRLSRYISENPAPPEEPDDEEPGETDGQEPSDKEEPGEPETEQPE